MYLIHFRLSIISRQSHQHTVIWLLCCICMNSELNDFEHTTCTYFFIGAVVESRSANIFCVFRLGFLRSWGLLAR